MAAQEAFPSVNRRPCRSSSVLLMTLPSSRSRAHARRAMPLVAFGLETQSPRSHALYLLVKCVARIRSPRRRAEGASTIRRSYPFAICPRRRDNLGAKNKLLAPDNKPHAGRSAKSTCCFPVGQLLTCAISRPDMLGASDRVRPCSRACCTAVLIAIWAHSRFNRVQGIPRYV